MEVFPGGRLQKSIKAALFVFCFTTTIVLISGSIADNNGVDGGQNVASELEGDTNSENKRSLSLLDLLGIIPGAESIAEQRPKKGIGKFELETQPSLSSGLPRIFYNNLQTSELFPEEKSHNHRKGHGHQKKHNRHHHNRPPKLEIQSETHITLDIRNNSVPTKGNTNKVNYIPQKLRGFSSPSTNQNSMDTIWPKTNYIVNRKKHPTGPLKSTPKKISNSSEVDQQIVEQFKAYYDKKHQLRNRTRPSPIKQMENSFKPVIKNPFKPVMENPFKPVMENPFISVMENPFKPVMENPFKPVMENPFTPVMEIRNALFKPLGSSGFLNIGTPQNIKPKDSIFGENKFKISPKDSNPFIVKMTSLAIDDGRPNRTAFRKISFPSEQTNNPSNKKLSIKPVSKSDLKLISDSMRKESFPQKVFTDEKGESVFHSKLSPGELLVPQKKYITMEIKTKTVRLPTTGTKSQSEPISGRNEDIQLRPISVINRTPAPPQRPITFIKSTNLFISMGNRSISSDPKKTLKKKSKGPVLRKGNDNISDAERKYKAAVQSLGPHCSGGSEILHGLKDTYSRFSEAKGWEETMKAFQTMTSHAATALGLCFQKMWDDTKSLFGRPKRSSQVDVEKAAKQFTDNFKTDVGQPIARFFGELSGKISENFGKRSTSEEANLVLGNEAENDFISSSLTRGARSQELISALGVSSQDNKEQPIN